MAIILSAVIITFNEEKNIERCINSIIDVVDEILVVDSYSTDKTEEICKKLKVSFRQKTWEGYSAAKNYGNKEAIGSYILSIDADESLSEELKNNILKVKAELKGIYSFNRLTNYCGRWIKNCGWYPDKKIRIFPKEDSYWNDSEIHENIFFKGNPEENFLHGDLLHYSFGSVEEHMLKINNYTTIEAQQAYKAGKRMNYFSWIFSPLFKFLKIFFIHKGFLDGFHGFLIASFSSYSKFLKYAKLKQLRYLNEKNKTA
ncbi:glycosyltransferase family 2 protein [soil metagenome]